MVRKQELTGHLDCAIDPRGLGGHSHGHACHLCEESTRHGHRLYGGKEYAHVDVATIDDLQKEHLDRSRSATKPMGEYEPTLSNLVNARPQVE
jgi:hypothetical protein